MKKKIGKKIVKKLSQKQIKELKGGGGASLIPDVGML